MKINVCVPTRGKLAYLNDFVAETARNAVLPGTRVVVGFDTDDPLQSTPSAPFFDDPRMIRSTAPREDSLGAKYNRCAKAYDADIYVMSMDDVAIATKGWDELLAKRFEVFNDGIGYVYFGREANGEALPAMMAVSRKVVDLVGFCPEIFPFWFNNSWVNEVATFIGGYGQRVLGSPIAVRYPAGVLPEPPRRDVSFWAQVFELTRPMRIEQANRLIAATDHGPTAKSVLRAMMRQRAHELSFMHSAMCDPAVGQSMVRVTEDRDPRHERLYQQALALTTQFAKAA